MNAKSTLARTILAAVFLSLLAIGYIGSTIVVGSPLPSEERAGPGEGPGVRAAAESHKRALLIGVHRYQRAGGVFPDLNTESDVAAIRAVLIRKFGFAPDDIVTLTSPS